MEEKDRESREPRKGARSQSQSDMRSENGEVQASPEQEASAAAVLGASSPAFTPGEIDSNMPLIQNAHNTHIIHQQQTAAIVNNMMAKDPRSTSYANEKQNHGKR